MRCPSCSSTIPDGAIVCPACGAAPVMAGGAIPGGAANEATGMAPLAALERMRDRVAGRYELLEILGQGGMGIVYRARDLQLGQMVAIKVLAPSLTQDPIHVDRLKQEIVTTRKISHPNVIRLHDFGLSGTEPFISMELLEGGTLDTRLKAGLLPVREAIDIAVGVAEGLAAAHAQGIVHRDVKPQNILFDEAGSPKLVDFGLARLASASRGNTVAGFTGTPYYMSPELFTGGTIGPASDLYSFGVMLFEIFTGKRPFEGKNLLALAEAHCRKAPPSPRSVRPEFPWELETVVARLLEKDPAKRYADVAELVSDLRDFQRGRVPQSAVAALAKRGAPMMNASRGQETIITRMPPIEERPSAPTWTPTATLSAIEITEDTVAAKAAAAPGSPARPRDPASRGSRTLTHRRNPLVLLGIAGVGIAAAASGYLWSASQNDLRSAAGKATPMATPTPLIAEGTATPQSMAAVRYGELYVIAGTSGPFVTYRGPNLLSKKSPLEDLRLPAGEHALQFRCTFSKRNVNYRAVIEADKTTSLKLDCATGAIAPFVPGKPSN